MIRFIKHYYDHAQDMSIFPVISLLIFMLVFVVMLIFVFKMNKKNIDELSHLPLDDDSSQTLNQEDNE